MRSLQMEIKKIVTMKYIYYGLIIKFLFLLQGCVTLEKAERKLDSNTTESARYCMDRFSHDSIILKTDTIVTTQPYEYSGLLDSIHNAAFRLRSVMDKEHDSNDKMLVYNLINQQEIIEDLLRKIDILKTTFKPCKDTTIFSTKTNVLTNTARERYLEGVNARDQEKIDRITHGRDTWRWIGLISSFLFLLLLFLVIWSNTHKV